jgi:hypothetical protein
MEQEMMIMKMKLLSSEELNFHTGLLTKVISKETILKFTKKGKIDDLFNRTLDIFISIFRNFLR